MPLEIQVQAADDHLLDISRVSPLAAVEELIWNALDADAKSVRVEFERTQLGGIARIRVIDTGHGIEFEQAERAFGFVGGSEKRWKDATPDGRRYHGREGKGRYRAFALGQRVTWTSHRRRPDGSVEVFKIEGDRNYPRRFRASDADVSEDSNGLSSGVVVEIWGISNERGLSGEAAAENLLLRLAPYLLAYGPIELVYDGTVLDPQSVLKQQADYAICVESEGMPPVEATLRVLEWRDRTSRKLFLCNKSGFALHESPVSSGSGASAYGPFSFSAYLLSDYLGKLHQQGLLVAPSMDSGFQALLEEAHGTIQRHFRTQLAAAAADKVQRMKNEGVYPYRGLAADPIEVAERAVFDHCAATVHEYLPQLEQTAHEQQKLMFRLLREALERNPGSLSKILTEVFRLPESEQNELAKLLERTTLSAIINTAKTVNDRLLFINGLENIVFLEPRKHVLERTQLHRMLINELWLFGEEYTLGADDVAFRTVLKEYLKYLGRKDLVPRISPSHLKGLKDVPDICLWSTRHLGTPPAQAHLFVELKRPTCKISLEVIGQVQRYASAVVRDKYFTLADHRFRFVAIGAQVAPDLEPYLGNNGEPGHYARLERADIYVYTWAQVTQSAKCRLEYLRERLKVSVQDNAEGMAYLKAKYPELLPAGV